MTSRLIRSMLITWCVLLITKCTAVLSDVTEDALHVMEGSWQVPDEQRLYTDLMEGYESSVRPVTNASNTVLINFSISLNQIVGLDERKQVLTTNVFIDQKWRDDYLQWEEAAYNGVRTLRVPASYVWLPDTFVFNNADDGSTGFMQGVYVLLSSNGTVLWPVPVKLKSSCKVDIRYFPFDEQQCLIRFGSWIYSGQWLEFHTSIDKLDLSSYMDNSEWELISVEFEEGFQKHKHSDEKHPNFSYRLHIRRRTFYYLFNIIVPCLMLSVLTLLTFWLPTTSGEKISLGLSVFLAFSMFMLLIAEEVPATSESVPLIGIYLTTVMTMTSVSVIMGVMVINLYNRGSKARHAPNWLKVLVLKWMCKLLRMTHDIERLAMTIRLDEEEELRYFCTAHNAEKNGYPAPARRRVGLVYPFDTTIHPPPDEQTLPSTSSARDGDLSKRFSQIERFPGTFNADENFTVNAQSGPQDVLNFRSGRVESMGSSNFSSRGADDDDDDDDDDEPVWLRRDDVMHPVQPLISRVTSDTTPRRDIVPQEAPYDDALWCETSFASPQEESHYYAYPPISANQMLKQRKKKPDISYTERKQASIVNNIVKNCKKDRALQTRKEMVVEWQTIATVIDRLLFWVFFIATAASYIIILFVIPASQPKYDPNDYTEPMYVLKKE